MRLLSMPTFLIWTEMLSSISYLGNQKSAPNVHQPRPHGISAYMALLRAGAFQRGSSDQHKYSHWLSSDDRAPESCA